MIGNLIATCEQLCFDYLKDEYADAFVKACTDGKFTEARMICEMAYISIKDFSIGDVMSKVVENGNVDILGWLVGKFNLGPSSMIESLSTYLTNVTLRNHLTFAKKFVYYFKPTRQHALSCLSSIANLCSSDDNLEYISWFVKKFDLSFELLEIACHIGYGDAVLWVLENYEGVKISSYSLSKIVASSFTDDGLVIIHELHRRFRLKLIDFADCSFNNDNFMQPLGEFSTVTQWMVTEFDLSNPVDGCSAVIQWMITEFNLTEKYIVRRISNSTHRGYCRDGSCNCKSVAAGFVYSS